MRKFSDRAKMVYLIALIIFIVAAGLFWLDYIGLLDMEKRLGGVFKKEAQLVLDAKDDEPSLIEREEFEKEKQKFLERVEDLDRREAKIVEAEKTLESEKEKIEDVRKGLDIEKKKLENEKKRYTGYERNVRDLAGKVTSIRPEEAVEIMIKWEEPLIVDVLRRIDADAVEQGRRSISPYLISLMPRDKASRIMYLMTQI
ncbi:MAG TPA: hypothetical protein VLM75_15605 [Spirochaetota bacterium]|nr:hypothetical protein [Spirochaetota bacterium]